MTSTKTISNIPFDDLEIGQQLTTAAKTISHEDIQLFAILSGDINPVHLDAEYAATTAFKQPIAHGMITGALISAALATQLPGPGSVYRSQNIKFRKPVFVDDALRVELTIKEKTDRTKLVLVGCKVINQDDVCVAMGEAELIATNEKISVQAAVLPNISIDNQ